jgi:GAF domain-containing protein
MNTTYNIQTLCGQLDRMEISTNDFVEGCTRQIARAVGCSRAGIWLFLDARQGTILHCLGVFDRHAGAVVQVPDEPRTHVEAYFDALEHAGHVMAEDVHAHPATAGLFDRAANAADERSLMAASFAVNGRLFGAFTCTEAGRTKAWTQNDLATLRRIGGRASLALAGATQMRQTTMPMPL